MNKNKIMASLLAFVMMLSVFAPSFAYASETAPAAPAMELKKEDVTGKLEKSQLSDKEPENTEINIYKLTTKESYSVNAPWKHNGGKISKEDYAKLGKDVKGLAGVKFTVYEILGKDDKEKEEILKKLQSKSANFETVDQMEQLINSGSNDPQIDQNKLKKAAGTGLTEGQTAETTEEGLATINLKAGYYWFVESQKPDKVVDKLAVPFGLTLPLVNSVDVDGVKVGTQYLKSINIYPKNIETDKPKMDKNHAKYDEKSGKWKDETGKEIEDKDLGADYEKYNQEKKTISAELGKKVPYEVKTEIPRNYRFETISWTDIMSEGLTFNKDLKVTVDYTADDGQRKTGEVFIDQSINKNTNFIVRNEDGGFDIKITKTDAEATIVKWLKNGPVTFRLNYSATVNNNTVVDKPQTNSITFKPGEPNPGGKVTPGADKSITVNKSWDKEPIKADSVTYYLVDNNGKTIASVTLNAQSNGTIKAGKGIDFIVGNKWYSGKFTGLEVKEYTIREAVDGYNPTFDDTNDATANITNNEDSTVIKPKEPKVEFHGKKFVKLDQLSDETRLAGAEFVVRREDTPGSKTYKYLVVKKAEQKIQEEDNVKAKKKLLDEAIVTFNKLSESDKKLDEHKNKVDKAQKDYNDAVIAARTTFDWSTDKKEAYVLVSDAQGRFEITGLSAGDYELEEITAPAGYALNDKGIEFEVKNGTYQGDKSKEIKYNENDENGGFGFKVPNKKYTIPQTGGIGTVIFTVAGLAIMGGAFYVMKKNNEEEEA